MSVDLVRRLTADLEQEDREIITGDGQSTRFRMKNIPVTGIIEIYDTLQSQAIDGTTLDIEKGIVAFPAAPEKGLAIAVTYTHAILSDATIESFLTLYSNDDRLAAAEALDTIATNQLLLLKAIQVGDLKLDGPAMMKAIKERAEQLRDQTTSVADQVSVFDWAEMISTPQQRRERVNAQFLREP